MSLPIIREREEDGDSPESDSELETCPSTVHHKTRRETSFSLEGALVSSQALYVTRIGVINSRGWLLTLSPQHDNHYEEIKERSTSEDQRRHSYHSNSGSSVQSSKSAAHLRHEGHYSYNCYEEVPAVVGQYRPSHPIHSLTQSDIEKALATSPLDTSRVVCYCFAICLAITFLIAIVMIISNIITNMYLTF